MTDDDFPFVENLLVDLLRVAVVGGSIPEFCSITIYRCFREEIFIIIFHIFREDI